MGVPYEDTGATEIQDAGAVNVLYGSPTRLSATGNQEWYQDSAGISGVSEANDYFGYALAAAPPTRIESFCR